MIKKSIKLTKNSIDDLKQYVTNLLYAAYSEGNKINSPKFYNPEFDKWVKENIDLLEECFWSKIVYTEKTPGKPDLKTLDPTGHNL